MADKKSSIAFEADISQFTKAIADMKSDITLINSEFDATASSMDDWESSVNGLQAKIDSLNKVMEDEVQKLELLKGKREEYQKTLDKNKAKLEQVSAAYEEAVRAEGENSNSAKKLLKEKLALESAISKNEKSIISESIAINRQQTTVNKTQKSINDYKSKLSGLNNELDDTADATGKTNDSFDDFKSKGGGMKKIALAIAAGIAAIGAAAVKAAKSFLDLADSTREYRTEMAKLKTISDDANANFERTKDTFQEMVAVTGDEGAATEAINNLLTAGFKGDELDEVTNYIQGAAIKWKDTLKAEGLSDSIQEWFGTGGESLTGQFAELLERLGYNLEEVKAKTAGMTEEQRKAWVIETLRKEGLGEITEAYKEENKTLIEASLAQQNLTDKLAVLGDAADRITTIFKEKFAAILDYITPLVLKLSDAFENLFKGNTEQAIQGFSESFLNLQTMFRELTTGILDQITNLIPTLLPKIAEFLGTMVQKFIEFIPVLLEASTQLLGAIVEALPTTLEKLLEQLPQILDTISTALTNMIPMLLEFAITFFGAILDAIPVVVVKLGEILPELIKTISTFIQENLPVLIEGFTTLLHTIIDALPGIISSLADALPEIINAVVTFVMQNLPVIFDAAVTLFTEILNAIPILVYKLIAKLPEIISTITKVLLQNLPLILSTSIALFMQIIAAIPTIVTELIKNLPQIVDTIITEFSKIDLFELGKDVLQGLLDGILSAASNIWETVKGIGKKIEQGFKDFFGIHSPSKLMHDKIGLFLGEGITGGIEDGFEKDIDKVKKSIANSLEMEDVSLKANVNSLVADNNRDSANNANGVGSKTINLTQVINSPKAISASEAYKYAKKMESRYKALSLGGVI